MPLDAEWMDGGLRVELWDEQSVGADVLLGYVEMLGTFFIHLPPQGRVRCGWEWSWRDWFLGAACQRSRRGAAQ